MTDEPGGGCTGPVAQAAASTKPAEAEVPCELQVNARISDLQMTPDSVDLGHLSIVCTMRMDQASTARLQAWSRGMSASMSSLGPGWAVWVYACRHKHMATKPASLKRSLLKSNLLWQTGP